MADGPPRTGQWFRSWDSNLANPIPAYTASAPRFELAPVSAASIRLAAKFFMAGLFQPQQADALIYGVRVSVTAQSGRSFQQVQSRVAKDREIDKILHATTLHPILVTNAFRKMKLSLTDTLCTRCGLCCDGSLFADVELANGDEAATLEVMGLAIEDADVDEVGLLLQPCGALQGIQCSIYPHRPECCRTFACRLLQEVERGMIGVERANEKIAEALKRIGRVKELIVQLGTSDERLPLKERCVEALALSEAAAADPAMSRKRAKLQAAMTAVERLIQATFLGG